LTAPKGKEGRSGTFLHLYELKKKRRGARKSPQAARHLTIDRREDKEHAGGVILIAAMEKAIGVSNYEGGKKRIRALTERLIRRQQNPYRVIGFFLMREKKEKR